MARVTARTPVGDLDLPAQARDALRKGGYRTAGQVAELSESELRNLRGVGEATAVEIMRVVEHLREEADKALTVPFAVAARRIGVSKKTFVRMIDDGEIPYVQAKRNAIRLVEVDELRKWIARKSVRT